MLSMAGGKKLGSPFGSKKKNPILFFHSKFIYNKIPASAKQIEIANALKVHGIQLKNGEKPICKLLSRPLYQLEILEGV